jgi:hypothetical protein
VRSDTLVLLAVALVTSAPLAAQVSPPASGANPIYVEPSDEVYVELIAGAVEWARSTVGKSLGVLAPGEASRGLSRAVEVATQTQGLRPIAIEDFTMVCFTRQATRSTPSSRTCSMKGAEAILQFSSVKVAGDSGYVGVGVTRVPKGTSRTEIVHHCLSFGRAGGRWENAGSEKMIDADHCPRERP